jgi:hypothetical protein
MRGPTLTVKDHRWRVDIAGVVLMNRDAGIAVGAASVMVAMLGTAVALNYSGLCLSQARHLTKQEIIEIGVRHYLRRYLPINYAQWDPTHRPIAFSSVEDFLSRDPNCCTVTSTGRDGGVPSLFHRLMGDFAGFVRIEYELDQAPSGGSNKEVVWVAVTNCGVPWNGVYWGR